MCIPGGIESIKNVMRRGKDTVAMVVILDPSVDSQSSVLSPELSALPFP
jgi:hypothetical protein